MYFKIVKNIDIFQEMSKNYTDSEESKFKMEDGKSMALSQNQDTKDQKQIKKLCC